MLPPADVKREPLGKPKSLQQKLINVLHVLLLLVSLSIAFCLFDNTLFAWHPVFMSIGYILFMAEGLISAVAFRNVEGQDRVKAIQSHALLQLRAVVCIILGFVVIYRNKVIHGKQHFTSLHAKVGLGTLVLSMLGPVVGAISFRRLGFLQKFPESIQPIIKTLHKKMGAITWFMAVVTIELALTHHAVNKGLLTRAWQGGCALLALLMLWLILHIDGKAKPAVDPLSKVV